MNIKAAFLGSLFGAISVILWYGINYCGPCSSYVMLNLWVDYVKLATWPSSILLIGDPADVNYGLQAFSALLNIVLFSLISFLVSLGKSKGGQYYIVALLVLVIAYYNSFKFYF